MKKQTFINLARDKYGDDFDYTYLPGNIERCVEIIICKNMVNKR